MWREVKRDKIMPMFGLMLAAAAAATTNSNAAIDPVIDAKLRDVLRDYDSAKVELTSWPHPFHYTIRCGLLSVGCHREDYDATSTCVRINAKNGYGGYTGWEYYYFIVYGEKVLYYGSYEFEYKQFC